MRLLIVTQVVDHTDPVLGFFHRWLIEFSKHVERIDVVCLFEGTHTLPENVHIHTLGKERGKAPSFIYALRFLALVWRLRDRYDTVFVHMNVEYIFLAGLLWKLLRKRIALWYVHGTVSLRLKLAVALADIVFTASPESCRVRSSKVQVIGHGIDTEFFSPDATVRTDVLLSVGRLTKSKHHDLAIRVAKLGGAPLHIAGTGPEEKALRALAHELSAEVSFLGGISQTALRDEYRRARALIHTSTTGSMDKVVLEALATNCPVVSTSEAYDGFPIAHAKPTPEALLEALREAPEGEALRAYIFERFSLSLLIPKLVRELSA
jgi:glycosyltransferase involved in cell wall biosynthesis